MAEKTMVFINRSLNPYDLINAAGEKVRVFPGEPVEIGEKLIPKFLKKTGFVEASKFMKRTSKEEALAKEVRELKAKLAEKDKPAADPLK